LNKYNFRTNFQGGGKPQFKQKEWKKDIFGKEFFIDKTEFLLNGRPGKSILVRNKLKKEGKTPSLGKEG